MVGASGFIGRHLVSKLRMIGVDFVEIGKDHYEQQCSKIFWLDLKCDIIVWLGSRSNPYLATFQPSQANGELEHFLKVVRDGIPSSVKVVFASSGGTVYSGDSAPFRESDIALGSNSYGELKSKMEAALKESSCRSTILRISNAYGPGQIPRSGQGVISHWLESIRSIRSIDVYGSLNQVRDYIYISDLVDALVAVILKDDTKDIYNIGSGVGTSLAEIVRIISDVTQIDFHVSEKASRSFDNRVVWLDQTKASNDLNWRTKVSLNEGIALTWSSLNV